MTYLLGAQLALSSLPGSALSAGIGWLIGILWRDGLSPSVWVNWRVPGWVVGEAVKEERKDTKGVRRHVEDEAGKGTGTDTADGGIRRTK